MFTITKRVRASLALAGTAVVIGACANDVTDTAFRADPQFHLGTTGGSVWLAKFGPTGTTATFSISATGGVLPLGATVTLNACDGATVCQSVAVWRSTELAPATSQVTITEISSTGNTVVERIVVNSPIQGFLEITSPATPSVTVTGGDPHTVAVRFKNIPGDEPPPPPGGFAGCTPGFWKQPQHFGSWTSPYTPSTQFSSVFANAFPGKTLLQIVSLGGGGLNALGRHAVAALLNAANPGIDYGMTTAQVIAGFNTAFASRDYTAQKNIFEGQNELDCTAN